MAKACNKPFVLVNEDNISELIKDSDDENTKIQIKYVVIISRMYLENCDISCPYCSSKATAYYSACRRRG